MKNRLVFRDDDHVDSLKAILMSVDLVHIVIGSLFAAVWVLAGILMRGADALSVSFHESDRPE